MALHHQRAVECSGAAGTEAHCRRTAAVAGLLGARLSLQPEEIELLKEACIHHHSATGLMGPRSLGMLLTDILGEEVAESIAGDHVSPAVRRILGAYERPGRGAEDRLADILRLAEAFDQEMETESLGLPAVGDAVERLQAGVEGGLWSHDTFQALKDVVHRDPARADESWRVPVFPQAAMQVLRLMKDPRTSMTDVVEAASMDPAIAGRVMQLANSALFGACRVTTLAQAIARLGFATSRKVITSVALKPVFAAAGPRLNGLWHHALHVADLAEQLAGETGKLDPEEAYLSGLVHDVGRIAVCASGSGEPARIDELIAAGCPVTYAENLVLGTDHAAIGARVAAEWRFPEEMVAAIAQHHSPEKTDVPLAYSLYLAEDLSGSEEDLPSAIRLERCLKATGLTFERISGYRVSDVGRWLAAA